MKKGLILFLSFCFISGFSQEKLKKAKENLKSRNEQTSGVVKVVEQVSPRRSYSNYDNESIFDNLIFQLTLGLVTSATIESPWETDTDMHFAELLPYPFYEKSKGDYNYELRKTSKFRLDLSSEYFTDFESVRGIQIEPNLRFGNRLGLRVNYAHYWEGKGIDKENLNTLFATLDYYRVRTPVFSLNWGIGVGYVANEVSKAGLALRGGAEINLKPISIQVNYKGTITGPYASVFEVSPSYHYKNYRFNVSYQQHGIGGINLYGMGAGVGIYL
ncbi:hypothetical protein KRX57_06475 [Weeksellaceae bacterium TAE3-ERU29]|nr:hypothetical protein [Weeksellaceae bacterium TAE3-ERU29]